MTEKSLLPEEIDPLNIFTEHLFTMSDLIELTPRQKSQTVNNIFNK